LKTVVLQEISTDQLGYRKDYRKKHVLKTTELHN